MAILITVQLFTLTLVAENQAAEKPSRIVYFGLKGDPRTPTGVDVDGVYFDGSKGYGPEK